MKAALLRTIPATRLELGTLPEPQPGPGELLLAVEACGICGTDLHILEGASYRPELPFVLGHEPVGRVLAAGSPADDAWIGRRVTMTLFTGCGRCDLCQAGDERLCPALVSIHGVLGAAGGFAELMTIRAAQAVAVPEDLPSDAAASLVDAGATAANGVRVAEGAPDGLAVVIGGGPVGFFVAELLRVAGREVVLVQPSAPRRAALAAIGHRAVTGLAELDDVTAGVVVDCAGAPEALPWALEHLRPQGMFVAAGYGPIDHLELAPAARKELIVTGVRSGRRADLEHVLGLVAAGRIAVPPIASWPLAAINDALAALVARRVPGKAIVHIDEGAGA